MKWMRTAAICAAVAMAGTASADIPKRSVYIGVYGGEHIPADDWQLGDIEGTGTILKESPTWGIRVGGFFLDWLGAEANFAFLPAKTTKQENVNIADIGASLIFQAADGRMGWYALLGGGLYLANDGVLGNDVDGHLHTGAGVKAMLWDGGALRLQGRLLMTDDLADTPNLNAELTAGLDFYIWRTADDRDEDGIADEVDACPDTPGVETAKGCPDADGDGFRDSKDKCPKLAGVDSAGGCPDADGDGITDAKDRCPKVKGPEAHKGCPDTDGDGIVDIDDKCPKVAGIKKFGGCPDTDGDGIQDSKDACPKQAGPARTKGCPDTDGDGIADKDDKCPKIPGVKKLDGCMPKAVAEKFQGALEGIYFKTGSAVIRKKSFKVLNEAVAILKEWPSVNVRIEGHTDDQGDDAYNMDLSEKRAASVRQYLVDNGIDVKRMDAKGYGETRPVADNKSRKGRAQNRRIEFRVITR